MIFNIEHWDEAVDGILTEQTMRNKLQGRGYQVTRYVYAPGTRFPDHSHKVDKIDAVLSGQFQMSMEGQSFVLGAGDCIAVPRGVQHNARVVGNEPVVSLDAVKY